MYPFSIISTSYDFDPDFMGGTVPLDTTHDMIDYERQQLQLARAAGAGKRV